MTDRLPTKPEHQGSKDTHSEPFSLGQSDGVQMALSLAAQDRTGKPAQPADESLVGLSKTFVKAAIHSGIEEPATALAQVVNHVAGTKISGPDFFGKQPQAEFGSKSWVAETVGSGFGMVVPFLLTEEATGGLIGKTRYAKTFGIGSAEAARSVKFLPAVTKSTLDGALFGLVLTPNSDPTKGFWEGRAINAMSGGLTFGTQAAVSRGLMAGLDKLGVPLENPNFQLSGKGMAVRLGSNAFGGGVAGVVSAESNSILSGHGLAKADDVKHSVASFIVTGIGMDAFHMARERPALQATADAHNSALRQAAAGTESSGITTSLLLPLSGGLGGREIGARRGAFAEPSSEVRLPGPHTAEPASRPAGEGHAKEKALHDVPQLADSLTKLENSVGETAASAKVENAAAVKAEFNKLVDDAFNRREQIRQPAEMEAAVRGVDTILNGKLSVDLSPAQRLGLAKQLLFEIGNPKAVDQGLDYTCGPALVQEMALHEHPGKQIEAITQLLTTGKFTTAGGGVVDLSPERLAKLPQEYRDALRPDYQARRSLDIAAKEGGVAIDGERSYASQLAQLLAGNIKSQVLAPTGERSIYVKGPVDRTNPIDSGERLFNAETGQPVLHADGQAKIGPGIQTRDLQNIFREIAGLDASGSDFVLINTREPLSSREGRAVQSPKQLRDALLSANHPFAVEVGADHPLLKEQAQATAAEGQQPTRHVLMVERSVNPRTGKPMMRDGEPLFNVYDQYGRKNDLVGKDGATAAEIFNAMRHPGESPAIHEAHKLEGVGNFGIVDERGFFRGRKPDSIEGIRSLKEQGVTLVIDLIEGPQMAPDGSGRTLEQQWIDEVGGMKYLNLKTSVKDFGPESVRQIFDAIEKELNADPPGKVFLHCARGVDRTGTISALWRLTHQSGWTPDLAKTEMLEFGHTGNTPSTRRMAELLPQYKMFGEGGGEATSFPESKDVGYRSGMALDDSVNHLASMLDSDLFKASESLQSSGEATWDALTSHDQRQLPQGILPVLEHLDAAVKTGEVDAKQAKVILDSINELLHNPDAAAGQTLFSALADTRLQSLSPKDVSELADFSRIVGDSASDQSALRDIVEERLRDRNSQRQWLSVDRNITADQIAELAKAGITSPTDFAQQMEAARREVPSFNTKDMLGVLKMETLLHEALDTFGPDNYLELMKKGISVGNRMLAWSDYLQSVKRVEDSPTKRQILDGIATRIATHQPDARVLVERIESDPRLNHETMRLFNELADRGQAQTGEPNIGPLLAITGPHFDNLVNAALAYDVPKDSKSYGNLLAAIERRATKDLPESLTPEERQSRIERWAQLIAKDPYSSRARDAGFSVLKAMRPEDFRAASDSDFATITRSATRNRIDELSLAEKKNMVIGLLADGRTDEAQRDAMIRVIAETPKLIGTLDDAQVRLVNEQADRYIERYEGEAFNKAKAELPGIIYKFAESDSKSVDTQALSAAIPEPYRGFVANALSERTGMLERGSLQPEELRHLTQDVTQELEAYKDKMGFNPFRPVDSNIRGFVNKLLSPPMTKTELNRFVESYPPADRLRVMEILQERAKFLSPAGLRKQFTDVAVGLRRDATNFVQGAKDSRGFPVEKIRVLTVGDASSGAALGYLFRKQTRIEIDPNVVSKDALGRTILTTGDGFKYLLNQRGAFKLDKGGKPVGDPVNLGKMVLFDPASKLPLDARSALSMEKPDTLQRFHQGANYFDVMAAGVGRFDALQRNVNGELQRNRYAQSMQSSADALEGAYNAVRGADQNDRTRLEASAKLYTISKANAKDKGKEIPPRLTAFLLRTGPEFIDGHVMMNQAIRLHDQIREFAGQTGNARPGTIPENVRFITNGDNGGSTHLVQHIYRLANGLTDPSFDRYFVPLDLQHSADIQGKKLIYLDDYAYTGKQAFQTVDGLRDWLKEHNFNNEVAAATLGAYTEGKQYFDESSAALGQSEADTRTLLTAQQYQDIRTELTNHINALISRKLDNLTRRQIEPENYGTTEAALARMRQIIDDYRAVTRSADQVFAQGELSRKKEGIGKKPKEPTGYEDRPKVVSHLVTPWMVSNDNPVFINDAVHKYMSIRALANSGKRMAGQNERIAFDTSAVDTSALEANLDQARQNNPTDRFIFDSHQAEFITAMERMAQLHLDSTHIPPTVKERARLFQEVIGELPFMEEDPLRNRFNIVPDATLDDANKSAFTQIVTVDKLGKTHPAKAEFRQEGGFLHVVPSGPTLKVSPYDQVRVDIHVPEQKLVDLSDPSRAAAAFAEIAASIYHQLHSLDQMTERGKLFETTLVQTKGVFNRFDRLAYSLDEAIRHEPEDSQRASLSASKVQIDLQKINSDRRGESDSSVAKNLAAGQAAEHLLELPLWSDLPFERPEAAPASLQLGTTVEIGDSNHGIKISGLLVDHNDVWLTGPEGQRYPLQMTAELRSLVEAKIMTDAGVLFGKQDTTALIDQIRKSAVDQAAMIARYLLEYQSLFGS